MEVELQKIRPHTGSNLPHQKAPANFLRALEATFEEQHAERTPAAYFGGLLTALESTVQKERAGKFQFSDGDILPAELYLLALVGPFVPAPIVRHHLNSLLSVTAPLWPHLNEHAPPLRSQLSLYNAILRALDRPLLDNQHVRQSFNTILQLCLDGRPKVRKRAADLVRDVLGSPPSPLMQHPYSERVGEWVLSSLADVNALGSTKQKGKKNIDEVTSVAIHLLSFIKPVLPYLPSTVLPSVTKSLLSLPRLGNPYLSQAAYDVLSDLLSIPEDPTSPRNIETSTADLLKAVISSPPIKTDTSLLPSWLHVIGQIMLVYSISDPQSCDAEFPKVWKLVFPFLESRDLSTRKGTAETLSQLSQCISRSLMEAAVSSGDSKSVLIQIIAQLQKSIDALSFARSLPELFFVISSLITRLRYRPGGRQTPSVAESLLLPLIQKIGDMRVKKGFEYKEAADEVLKTAMSVVGPEVLLRVLPLNLEPEDRTAGREPRAYVLPLLAHNHPTPLGHFISYFVPLTERMFDLQQKADADGRASEAKVWSVLVSQVWSGLPAYCYRTPDLKSALNPQFAQMLSQLLYNQPDLRAHVLKALKVIVTSNTSETIKTEQEDTDDLKFTEEEIANNTKFLRSQSESWLAVLFNVFSSVGRDGQGLVGETISTWAAISDKKSLTKTCQKVIEMLKTNMSKANSAPNRSEDDHSVTASLLDILILMVPHISDKDARAVFDLCLTPEILKNRDNGVQKRAYKLLTRLAASGKVQLDVEKLFSDMDAVAEDALPAAKKDRMNFFTALLSKLDRSSLHVIPSLISEAVLGTKEPSEKARTSAFELIVAMGHKMKEGGTVKRAQLNGMDEDDMTEVAANLQEYFTMMAGGLAGASPHMISATITAISRLMFEFKDDLSKQLLSDIFATMLVYVTSANREIVKSTLGFIKLAIHSLPVELLRPHLPQLVPALLTWSHDHKNHFKEKVKHIFERMLRRFGWDEIFTNAGEDEEGKKVLLNIKKRKERAKRKKAQRTTEDDGDEESQRKATTTGDAFEDVLYGSESESEESDQETKGPTKSKKSGVSGARLRLDHDEPMDLLAGANTRIISTKSGGRRNPGKLAGSFKTDEESGKMVIDDEVDTEVDDDDAAIAGAAYRESITSADGFTRGSQGRIKFNKDTKKRRRDNEAGSDVEMGDAAAAAERRKKMKRKSSMKLGQEFKAKNAGGDVKRGNVDPYAYVTLSQAAKGGKAKGRGSFTVTGKR